MRIATRTRTLWRPSHRRLAVLSDAHGNLGALDAVLADIDRRGISDMVHLGDVAYGPLDPRGTAQRLIDRGIPSVRGNEDRLVAFPEGPNDTIEFTRSVLRGDQLRWLGELPFALARGPFYLCHGSPRSDAEYLLTEVSFGGLALRAERDLAALVSAIDARVILCGHDHLPRLARLADGHAVIDPGSVGCPAYSDDQPAAHTVENGSPHARYAIMNLTDEWSCEHVAVDYDWEQAARLAERNGRPDWAYALRTGRVAVAP